LKNQQNTILSVCVKISKKQSSRGEWPVSAAQNQREEKKRRQVDPGGEAQAPVTQDH
jgi:hypothetical protein